MSKKIIVTGGAGFIGSALIRYLINETNYSVVNIDKLTYAGHLESLREIDSNPRYKFYRADISSRSEMNSIIFDESPDYIMHLAAESHVDRSIDSASDFINTNIVGTFILLDEAKKYYSTLEESKQRDFRLLHVSTDEVYGTLGKEGLFTESTPYDPRSPYSASKASSDHIASSWFHTYNFPLIITNCSNNYGPFQFPEKLVPVVIIKALQGKDIPVYGAGDNVRDWLFVDDHAKGLLLAIEEGTLGETYNIGGKSEQTNIDVVRTICTILDNMVPKKEGLYKDQITYVDDRPGHDFRYAIDSRKIESELGWKRAETFETGITKTVEWYLNNMDWCEEVTKNNYNLSRLGTKV